MREITKDTKLVTKTLIKQDVGYKRLCKLSFHNFYKVRKDSIYKHANRRTGRAMVKLY